MTWSARQTHRFSRQYKKLHNNTAVDVDSAVEDVTRNPQIGERKKGDLAALRVYKFYSGGLSYLLGYTLDEGVRLIYLEAVGPHENFYRDLESGRPDSYHLDRPCVCAEPPHTPARWRQDSST